MRVISIGMQCAVVIITLAAHGQDAPWGGAVPSAARPDTGLGKKYPGTPVVPFSTSIFHNAIALYQRTFPIGHCQFSPSCSRYAQDAIRRHGVLPGLALAADRITRCHPWAAINPYPVSGVHLRDPVDDVPAPEQAAVQGEPAGTVQVGAVRRAYLAPDLLTGESGRFLPAREDSGASRIALFSAEDKSELGFGCALFAEGDYYRAVTEFKRHLFLHPDDMERPQVVLLLACALYLSGRHAELHAALGQDRSWAAVEAVRPWGLYLDALAYSAEGSHLPAAGIFRGLLDDRPPDALAERILLRLFISQLRMNGYIDTTGISGAGAPFGAFAARMLPGLTATIDRNRSTRSPLLATLLSAILPGSGQAYCGRYSDGIAALVVTGGLALLTANAYSNEYALGTVVGGILTAQFYAGNIIGANRAAHLYNVMAMQECIGEIEAEWLSRDSFVLRQAGHTYYLSLGI